MQSQPVNDLYEHDVAPLVPEPPLRAPPRHTDLINDRFANKRPSAGRRMSRALARFFVAILIGVGATLAWQSYGDAAKQMLITRAPSLGWLLSVSTKSPPDGQVPTQDAAVPQAAPATQTPAPAASVASAEIVQQLEPVTHDLAAVQRSLEQLAVKQDQMAQSIATLQAVEEDIKQRLASPLPSRAVPIPPRRPPHSATRSSAVQSSSVPPPPVPTQQPLPLH